MAHANQMDEQEFFERRIITGLVVSRDYLSRVARIWDPGLLSSPELCIIATWCFDYFKMYNRPPDTDIQSIYMEQLQNNTLSTAEGEYIELLLTSLSDEYGRDAKFNSAYLYDRTVKYLKAQELDRHSRDVQALVDAGRVKEAEELARTYTPTILDDEDTGLELSSEDALVRIERAFTEAKQAVLSYPGALGDMWNDHLVRGGFFTLLAPEKRGKSFMLMEMALRAIREKSNVAFFEAGDMTEAQILRRICVYLSRRSDNERYCEVRFRPVGDCILNQIDLCTREDRNCDHGIFDGVSLGHYYDDIDRYASLEHLMDQYEQYPDYAPCDSHTCMQRRGCVWLKRMPKSRLLTADVAKKEVTKFFKRYRRRFRLITYPAGTLTVSEIRRCLNDWERHDGFMPDVVVIDYADLLSTDDTRMTEFRHRQDAVWKALRGLSQERHVLLLTATQADADSYKRGTLSMSNFSEDKRKLAHVTAQYGLNQDPAGREKKLGIMRINEIVVREGSFSADHEVTVLQDLAAGRPFLESF